MLGFWGLPKVKLKHSFWLYVLALILATPLAFVLESLFEKALTGVVGTDISNLAMFFIGYLISYSVMIVLYEGLKTGHYRLSWKLLWRMFMAWLRTITIVLPALILLGIGALLGIGIAIFVNSLLGALVFGISVLGWIALIPLSIILQWYWYERGVNG